MASLRSRLSAFRRARSAPTEAVESGPYGSAWDSYVTSAEAGETLPGDEWGDPKLWQAWYETLLEPAGAATWQRAVEIGQGSGKYTEKVLEAGCRQVLACDVSAHFVDLCRRRLATMVEAGRLHLQLIDSGNPRALQEACSALGWQGQVDGIFSIDTMVHVDFNLVAGYLLAGTEVLRPGGTFAMTFADGTSEQGFNKLFGEIDAVIRAHAHPGSLCFRWVTPELVAVTATRLGYSVIRCERDPRHGRDGILLARFEDPERAKEVRLLAGRSSR
jgi:SAM-dependent methyltransferase